MPDIWWRFREAIQGQPTIDVGWFVQAGCQRADDRGRPGGHDAYLGQLPRRPRPCPAWSRRRLTIPRRPRIALRGRRCPTARHRCCGLQRQRSHHRPDGGHLRSPGCAAPRASSIRSSMMPGTSFKRDAGKTSRMRSTTPASHRLIANRPPAAERRRRRRCQPRPRYRPSRGGLSARATSRRP